MRIQEALLTVQFTFQFNHFNHFAPSVHQQTPASSSYTVPVQDSALHFTMALALRLSVLSSHISPIGASQLQVITFSVSIASTIYKLNHISCSVRLYPECKIPIYVLANTCCYQNVTIISILLTSFIGQIPTCNLVLYLPAIQFVQITQRPPHRLLPHPPCYSFFLLPAPRPHLGFHCN